MRQTVIPKRLITSCLPDKIDTFIDPIKKVIQNTSWMLVSEACARASRLVTIIIMANVLSSIDYGLAMLALVCHELLRTLSRIGSGGKIIQCLKKDLNKFAGNAYALNWIISIVIAALQFILAPYIASYYSAPDITPLLRLMAASYLIYPWVAIKVHLLQRENRMKYFNLCNAAAISTDNLATALFLSLGMGIYAVAYAKILAALVWVLGFRSAKTERIKPQLSLTVQIALIAFSSRVLGSELLKALRGQIDILLAGRLLAPEIFGLYSFAKSAGVGLSQSLSNAFLAGIYPRLADFYRGASDHTLAYTQGKKVVFGVAAVISLIFIGQSLAAPVYIPILFDDKWHSATALVSILCLSAIPAMMLDTSALIQRVQYCLNSEMALQLAGVAILFSGLLISNPDTAIDFAVFTTGFSFTWILLSVYLIRPRLDTAQQHSLQTANKISH